MSTNNKWSPTDPKHFEGKTMNELQADLTKAESVAIKYPEFQFGWHNGYRHELKRRIAEMIGRKS